MSDIDIDLSGIIALLIFLISAGVMGICGLIAAMLAFFRGRETKRGIKGHPAFGFFAAAASVGIINLVAFGILLYFVDSSARESNGLIDTLAAYAWLPLQPVVWIAGGFIYNKQRK